MSDQKQAIVLAAFGASSEKARAVYGFSEKRVHALYPGATIRRAYLSKRIVASQRKQGIVLPTIAETLAELESKGFTAVAIQPLLVVPGEEFELMKADVKTTMRVAIGAPLLSSPADIQAALKAVAPLVVPNVPNVLVTHGNRTYSQYNEPLLWLKRAAEASFDNLIVASVEGEPGTDPLMHAREMAAGGKVVFIPFMLVAGEHIQRDVMGDEQDSWKSQVGATEAVCLDPLGNNAAIVAIYLDHLRTAVEGLKQA